MSKINPAGYFLIPAVAIIAVLWLAGILLRSLSVLLWSWEIIILWPLWLAIIIGLVAALIIDNPTDRF